GHTAAVPKKCPACSQDALIYSGFGTEKVEANVAHLFPGATVRRMDADSMSRKDAYRETLHAFRAGKIDILVGTQMIAKGLHFPNVTLVGIIHADLALHMPASPAESILGARSHPPLEKVQGQFRFHILMRGEAIMRLSRLVRETLDKLPLPEDVSASVDVDPYQLL